MPLFRQYLNSRVFLNFIALIAVLGSIAYLSIGLMLLIRLLVAVLAAAGSVWLQGRFPSSQPDKTAFQTCPKGDKTLIAAYALSAILSIAFLISARSDSALITPWQQVSSWFFVSYAAATFSLWLLKGRLSVWLLGAHYALTFSVFIIVYAIGYGFDPFIHEAAVKVVENAGRIEPLTIYYLGQYSLVSIFHTILSGSVALWDKLLVPLLAALTLPFALHESVKEKTNAVAGGLALLLFSFAAFTLTTPQNLAYLFLVLAVLLSLRADSMPKRLSIWLLALAAFFTQPIAGIPALILAVHVSSEDLPEKFRRLINWLSTAAYAFVLPAAFYFLNGSRPSLSWPDLGGLFAPLLPGNPSTEIWWLNFVYLFADNRTLIFIILAAAGAYAAYRVKNHILLRRYGVPALALSVSAILAASLDFKYLIAYERFDYPGRLLTVAALFALPLVLAALRDLLQRITTESPRRRYAWYLLLALLITASVYLSYPRFDNYNNSRAYATSAADLAAVQWIEKDAGDSNYIALANQQVSAAALRQSGFKTYYKGDIFYYPIPTGGPLYALYLKMLENPSRETMQKAMDLAGVDTAYFVVNEYWWAADKIIDETKQIADTSQAINDRKATVFRFKR